MSHYICRCMPSGAGCEDGLRDFNERLDVRINATIKRMREEYARRNAWATGGGGRGLRHIGESLVGFAEHVEARMEGGSVPNPTPRPSGLPSMSAAETIAEVPS